KRCCSFCRWARSSSSILGCASLSAGLRQLGHHDGLERVEGGRQFFISHVLDGFFDQELFGQQGDDQLQVVLRPLGTQLHDELRAVLPEIPFERFEECAAERVANGRRSGTTLDTTLGRNLDGRHAVLSLMVYELWAANSVQTRKCFAENHVDVTF